MIRRPRLFIDTSWPELFLFACRERHVGVRAASGLDNGRGDM